MATILVVDDRTVNRELMKTILAYRGHTVLEARHGEEALDLATTQSPQVIISDILMPHIDGFEFARKVRQIPAICATPIMFSSAHYVTPESHALANACGVDTILPKPCEPQMILDAVDEALLNSTSRQEVSRPGEEFNFDHLAVVTNKLSSRNEELRVAKLQVSKLIQLGQQIIEENEPSYLVKEYCAAAREIIGAQCAALGILNDGELTVKQFVASGLDGNVVTQPVSDIFCSGVIAEIVEHRASRLLHSFKGKSLTIGLPPSLPPVFSFVGVPIASANRTYGWLCCSNKLGADQFSQQDEELLNLLAIQLGVSYENARLYREAKCRADELEQEVNERKRAEEARAFLASIVESSNDAILGATLDEIIVSWNKGAEKMFGYTADEVIGRHTSMFASPDYRGEGQLNKDLLIRGKQVNQIETVRLRKDGKEIEVALTLSPVRDASGNIIGSSTIVRDITERKRAEDELRKQKEVLQRVFDHSPVMISFADENGNITLANRQWERTLGWTREEILEPNVNVLAECYPDPELYKKVLDFVNAASGEWTDFKIRARDGRMIDTTWARVRLSDGTSVGIGQDITERKRAEDAIAKAHISALESARIKAEFLSNMSHELRTPMNGIIGFTGLMLETDLTEEQRTFLGMITNSADSMMALINNILTFSESDPDRLETCEFSLEEHIHESVTAFSISAQSKGLSLSYQISPDAPATVVGDPERLNKILRLLVDNAVKFTERGDIEVSAAVESWATDEIGLLFTVRDTGIGIPDDRHEMIFNPFTQVDGSASRKHGGAGLGLAICRHLVEMVGDRLWVESEPGLGSAFHFTARFKVSPTTPQYSSKSRAVVDGTLGARSPVLLQGS